MMIRLMLLISGLLAANSVASQSVIEKGRWLYLNSGGYGCAVCHGPVAEGAGQAGGAIRGATLAQIDAGLQTVTAMQPLSSVLSVSDRQALAAYLSGLASVSQVTIRFNGADWQGEFLLNSTSEVDLVVYNASFDAIEVDLSPLKLGTVAVAALARESYRVSSATLIDDLQRLKLLLRVTQPPNDNAD